MSQPRLADEPRAFLEAHPDTHLIEELTPDMCGTLRGKRIACAELSDLYEGGSNFCAATVILDSKGAIFDRVDFGSRDGDPDVMARAVPGSLSPVPWLDGRFGQVLLELWNPDGTPFFADPRQVLRGALEPLSDLGFRPVVATELEFFFLVDDGAGYRPRKAYLPGSERPQHGVQYASLDDLVDVDPFLRDLEAACRVQRIPAGAALSEYAPGQFEVNLHHVDDPVLACDHAVLLKRAVKGVARQHDLAASFMAKPFADYAGCGMHVHISLLDADGNNVFAGHSQDGDFSDTLRHAIGGMAATMAESMAIFAPNANSYRRFASGLFSARTCNWGTNHRELAMRIPLSSPLNTRVEHRVCGADANPYLAMAAILAGIHHGIARQCDPGPMVRTRQVLDEATERNLPGHWEAALDAFEQGGILPDYLGQYHALFASCRREECDRFRAEISHRDFEWYLRCG